MTACPCGERHRRRRIVLTGGPGAGKTATLELVRQALCDHVRILPEAAGILFTGGFPRHGVDAVRRAVQRAIFFTQRELEAVGDTDNAAIVLCDRGTIDGFAYWPGPDDFFAAVGTTLDEQLERYDAVIHLRTPDADGGYNHANPLRTEGAVDAAAIDLRIAEAWSRHPHRFVVEAAPDFMMKAARAIDILRGELPACCRAHLIDAAAAG
jgi:predicted ATPase